MFFLLLNINMLWLSVSECSLPDSLSALATIDSQTLLWNLLPWHFCRNRASSSLKDYRKKKKKQGKKKDHSVIYSTLSHSKPVWDSSLCGKLRIWFKEISVFLSLKQKEIGSSVVWFPNNLQNTFLRVSQREKSYRFGPMRSFLAELSLEGETADVHTFSVFFILHHNFLKF